MVVHITEGQSWRGTRRNKTTRTKMKLVLRLWGGHPLRVRPDGESPFVKESDPGGLIGNPGEPIGSPKT